MNFHKFPSILFLFIVTAFFAGCEQNHIDSSINLSVSPPSQIDSRSLPTVCSDHSRADITIDNVLIGTLEKQENSDNWHGSFHVPSGKHSVGIRFVCILNRFEEITLATSSKDYDSSSGNSINFTSNDYILPDNNGDNEPNITELINGTDPGPEPGTPNTRAIQITHENWKEIYKTSMEAVRYIASTAFAATKSNCVDSGSVQPTPGATDDGYTLTNHVFQSCVANGVQLDGDLAVRQPQPPNNNPQDVVLTSQHLVITNSQEAITALKMHIESFDDANNWRQDTDLDLMTNRGRISIETERPLSGHFLDSYPDSGALIIDGAKGSFLKILAEAGSNQDAGFSVHNSISKISDTILWNELGWELIRFSE